MLKCCTMQMMQWSCDCRRQREREQGSSATEQGVRAQLVRRRTLQHLRRAALVAAPGERPPVRQTTHPEQAGVGGSHEGEFSGAAQPSGESHFGPEHRMKLVRLFFALA